MGTRSIIKFVDLYDGDEYPLVTIYQQYDGYISGVGHELAEWLIRKTIINGIPIIYPPNVANGIGCLVAQFIRDFKTDVGGLYIEPNNCSNQDYNYKVILDKKMSIHVPNDGIQASKIARIIVTNFDNPEPIFDGTPEELLCYEEYEE